MRTHYALDLGRRHLQSADVDLILHPAGDRQVAVQIERPNIAGMQPAVTKHRRLLFWPVPIPNSKMGTPDADFAFGAGGHGRIFRISNLDLDTGRRPADGCVSRWLLLAQSQEGGARSFRQSLVGNNV